MDNKNIKFTSDGKKVVVIGNLNSQEKIVQEIFIVDDCEIPSGEHFVVSSLHDAPAISWKEKNLKELEERYEKDRKMYERDIESLRKSYRQRNDELRAKLQYAGLALKNVDEKSFEMLVDYITGEIEWIVVVGYSIELLSIKDFNQMYEDKLRLVSLFGKDDGTFTYAIGDYYDYSGNSKKFIPFKNYDDAFEKFKEVILSKSICNEIIKQSEKYGFELDSEKLKEFKEKEKANVLKNISSYETQIEKWNEYLSTLN